MDSKIGKTFKLTKKLGSGAFGEIFHGINVIDSNYNSIIAEKQY
jgi:hypothetical protein